MAQSDGPPPAPAGELLTQKQYAQRKGWSKQYVNQLVKKGRIPLQGGKIDPRVADAALARDRDPAQDRVFKTEPLAAETFQRGAGQPEPTALHGSFTKARTVREHYRALRERLEYEQQAGKLVLVSEVEDACYEAARDFRDRFQIAAERIGQTIAAKFGLDEREVTEIITAEVRTTLCELSRQFKEKALRYMEQESAGSEE